MFEMLTTFLLSFSDKTGTLKLVSVSRQKRSMNTANEDRRSENIYGRS